MGGLVIRRVAPNKLPSPPLLQHVPASMTMHRSATRLLRPGALRGTSHCDRVPVSLDTLPRRWAEWLPGRVTPVDGNATSMNAIGQA
jgi:hypothetical protein